MRLRRKRYVPPRPRLVDGAFHHPGPREHVVLDARVDALTCPACRVAVNLGMRCSCPMAYTAR